MGTGYFIFKKFGLAVCLTTLAALLPGRAGAGSAAWDQGPANLFSESMTGAGENLENILSDPKPAAVVPADKPRPRYEKVALARSMALDWARTSILFLASPESDKVTPRIDNWLQLFSDYRNIETSLKNGDISFYYKLDGEPDSSYCAGTHYIAYTLSSDRRAIYLCNSAFELSPAGLAQKFVHEMQHNIGSTRSECAATQAEMLSAIFGAGIMPSANGYTDPGGQCYAMGRNIGLIYRLLHGEPAEMAPPRAGDKITLSAPLWEKLLAKKFLTFPEPGETVETQLKCHLDIYRKADDYAYNVSRPKSLSITRTDLYDSRFSSLAEEPGLIVSLECAVPTGMPMMLDHFQGIFHDQITLPRSP